MPVEDGFVGMVDREPLTSGCATGPPRRAARPAARAASRRSSATRTAPPSSLSRRRRGEALEPCARRIVVGADGANSKVARAGSAGAAAAALRLRLPRDHRGRPRPAPAGSDAARCDVYYQGRISPDFYAWVFPHGDTASIGTGRRRRASRCAARSPTLRSRPASTAPTLRREGAPIPLKPLQALGQWPRRDACGRRRRRRGAGLGRRHLLRDAGRPAGRRRPSPWRSRPAMRAACRAPASSL